MPHADIQGDLSERPSPAPRRRPPSWRRPLGLALITAVAATASFAMADSSASAWKPYTHTFSGDTAYQDAVGDPDVLGDGDVKINGVEYPINPRLGTRCRPQGVVQRRCGRAGRLPGPGHGPVRDPPGEHRQVAAPRAQQGVGGTDRRPLRRGPEARDPRLRLRLPDPCRRRHVGAHARQRLRSGRVPGGRRHLDRSRAGDDRPAPHHHRGLHRRCHPGLRRQRDRTAVPGEPNEDGDPEVSDDATHGIEYEPRRTSSSGRRSSVAPRTPGCAHPAAARPADRGAGPLSSSSTTCATTSPTTAGTNSNIQQAINDLTSCKDAID